MANRTNVTEINRLLEGLALAALVAFFVAWQLNHLGGRIWEWDEGVYSMTARLVAQGNELYRDVFANAAPLFINSLNLGFWLAGDSISVGRAVIVCYSAVGLLAVGLLAGELGGGLAARGSVVFLALAPHFYMLSRVIIADVPSMSLACLALWAAFRYQRTGKRGWLGTAGLALFLGAMIKLSAVLVGPAMLAPILARDLGPASAGDRRLRGCTGQDVGTSLAALGGSFLLPVVVCTLVYPWRLVWDQLIRFLWIQRDVFVNDPAANARMLLAYLVTVNLNIAANRGLTLLALVGAGTLTLRSFRDAAAWWLWFGTICVTLITYAPLWPHLLSPILFPLAVAAGVALGELQRRGAALWIGSDRRWLQRTIVGALALAALMYGYYLPGVLHTDRPAGACTEDHEWGSRHRVLASEHSAR